MTANPVLAALAQARLRAAPMFARWCDLSGATFCPAAPATVARFVTDCGPLGIARLWPAIQDISKTHSTLGLADPTRSDAVTTAISNIAGLAPPRSWPEDRKQQFTTLPYDLQRFIADHEVRREKALRRVQNEAGALRRKLSVPEQKFEAKAGEQTDEVKRNEADGKPVA